jgi:hypothetical protein
MVRLMTACVYHTPEYEWKSVGLPATIWLLLSPLATSFHLLESRT